MMLMHMKKMKPTTEEISICVMLLAVVNWSSSAPTTISTLPPPKIPKMKSEPRCVMHFSEFCFGFHPDIIVDPYIKLKLSCEARPGPVPRNILSGYRLLILQAEPLAISFVVNFDLHDFPIGKEFIVLGSNNVENVDILLSSGRIQSVFPKYLQNPAGMLLNPHDKHYSLILLHGVPVIQAKKLQLDISEDGKPLPKLLGQSELASIGQYITDMVILPMKNSNNFHMFDLIWRGKALPNRKQTIPNFEGFSTSSGTLSMSECENNYKGFNGESFRLSKKTPGKKNICSLEDQVISAKTFADASCGPETDVEIHPESTILIHKFSPQSVETYRSNIFPIDALYRCRTYFPSKEYILDKLDVQSWIRFEENNCKFFCSVCKLYFDAGFRPDVKRRPAIMKASYLSKDIYDNSGQIKKHDKNDIHIEATKFVTKLLSAKTENEITDAVQWAQNEETRKFNATMNLLVFTYTEIKAGLSFQTHEELINTVNRMGVNIGCHHQTAVAASYIADVFSSTFHRKLLMYLIENQVPFSIIVDGSTNQNQAFLIVFIQTLKENHSVTHFYCLLHLSHGETGSGMAAVLISQIKADEATCIGFESYFKKNLVSIVSDGASNMVAPKNSFKASMVQYLGKFIPNVVCMAHKLDNAIKLGLKPKPEVLKYLKPQESEVDNTKWNELHYFTTFEKTTNEFYTFYVSRGHKKWNHLLETAEQLQMLQPKKLKFFYAIRWSESHFNALYAIQFNYEALVADLDLINRGRDFDSNARRISLKLFDRMTDKLYAIVLHEFLDLLNTFKIASKLLQQGSANMIGKLSIVQRLLESLTDLQINPGQYVKSFLQDISCTNTCNLGVCTLSQFDHCSSPVYKGIILKPNSDYSIKMSEERRNLYSNLIDGVNHYFDINILRQYELFNAINFADLNAVSAASSSIQLYNSREVTVTSWFENQLQYFCEFYGVNEIDCTQFSADWFLLLNCLLTNEGIQEVKTGRSEDFWALALLQCNRFWTPLSKDMNSKALVTPFSSAECERGFSVLNNVRTKTRSRMDKSTLESLIRVKINGPNSQDLNVYEYTKAFLQKYARSDDTEFCGGRKPDHAKLPAYFQKSRIY